MDEKKIIFFFKIIFLSYAFIICFYKDSSFYWNQSGQFYIVDNAQWNCKSCFQCIMGSRETRNKEISE